MAEGVIELAAFHPGLPESAGAEQVPVDEMQADAVKRSVHWFAEDGSPQRSLVERAEPEIVVSRQDFQDSSPAAEFGECAQAVAIQKLSLGCPGGHPEVAKITGDDEPVAR